MSYVLVSLIFCKGGRNAGELKSICSLVHSGNGAKLMPSAASVLWWFWAAHPDWFLAEPLHINWGAPSVVLLSEISKNEP